MQSQVISLVVILYITLSHYNKVQCKNCDVNKTSSLDLCKLSHHLTFGGPNLKKNLECSHYMAFPNKLQHVASSEMDGMLQFCLPTATCKHVLQNQNDIINSIWSIHVYQPHCCVCNGFEFILLYVYSGGYRSHEDFSQMLSRNMIL